MNLSEFDLIIDPTAANLAAVAENWQQISGHTVNHLDNHWQQEDGHVAHRFELGLQLLAKKVVISIFQTSGLIKVRVGGLFTSGEEEGLFESWSDDPEKEFNEIHSQIKPPFDAKGFRRYKRLFLKEYGHFVHCLSSVVRMETMHQEYDYNA